MICRLFFEETSPVKTKRIIQKYLNGSEKKTFFFRYSNVKRLSNETK